MKKKKKPKNVESTEDPLVVARATPAPIDKSFNYDEKTVLDTLA